MCVWGGDLVKNTKKKKEFYCSYKIKPLGKNLRHIHMKGVQMWSPVTDFFWRS